LQNGGEVADADILDLLSRISSQHKWSHLEKLQEFDGAPSYTLAQGED
jgi:isocitrate dehydrogenase